MAAAERPGGGRGEKVGRFFILSIGYAVTLANRFLGLDV